MEEREKGRKGGREGGKGQEKKRKKKGKEEKRKMKGRKAVQGLGDKTMFRKGTSLRSLHLEY